MTQEEIQFLANIHNALMQIETKGENTIIMSTCLNGLKTFVESKIKENQKEEE